MLLQPLVAQLTLGTISVGLLFLASLSTISFLIYNRLIHPLRKIPGPVLASITPWVQLYHGLKGDRHLWLHELHQQYGSHVRVAPNFVSVNTTEGLHDIYGHGKKFKKADFYNGFTAIKGIYNTHNVIDKTAHGRKRRVLSQAFSESALKAFESVMLLHIRQLCSVLSGQGISADKEGEMASKQSSGSVRNMSDWFGYLTYDVMGELCFGKSFDMLVESGRRHVIGLVDRAAYRHYVCGLWMPLDSWHLDQLFIHKLTNDRWRFIQNSRAEASQRAQERTKAGRDAKKDFFYYLLNAKDPETGEGLTIPELWGESNVLMIAGSDTTSTGLASTVFYLLHNPRSLEILQKEVTEAFTDVEQIVTGPRLNELVYLKACIDEAMRLAPAVPGAMPRETMAGGAEVDGVHLPEGTNCGTPCFSIHRQEAYYPNALSYIPERWIEGSTYQVPFSHGPQSSWTVTKDDVEIARRAFCPFSIGPRGCIGKSMALMEMKLTLARILLLFDLKLADRSGEDETGHFKLVDHFTSQKSGPRVEIRRRF